MRLKGVKTMILLAVICCVCATILWGCNDTISYSKTIFIDDFSDTYTISIPVKVKNHSVLPEPKRVFEYSKGYDKLYETISASSYASSVYKSGDKIIIDIRGVAGRMYSCMIYQAGEKNKYIVDSMTYVLEWANNRSIFFPSYLLNKGIAPSDAEGTIYRCEFDIEALKNYYVERGYYAQIDGNTLKVVCMLRYPNSSFGDESNYGYKAIAWSVVYENENDIRFSDISDDYNIRL